MYNLDTFNDQKYSITKKKVIKHKIVFYYSLYDDSKHWYLEVFTTQSSSTGMNI